MVQFPHSSSVQSKLLHQVCYEHLEHLYLKDDAKQQSWVEPAASSFHQLRKSSGSKTQFESSKSTCKCICTPSRKPSREVLTLTRNRKVTAHATAWNKNLPELQVPLLKQLGTLLKVQEFQCLICWSNADQMLHAAFQDSWFGSTPSLRLR